MTTDDYSRLVVAAGDLEKLALSLDDARSPSLSQVRERAAALKLVGPEPLALIIVDGFELLSIPAACSHASKVATYTTQLWELKALADELECPVMVTAQSVASWGREGPSEAASDVFLPADMVLEVDCEADEVGGPARARLGKVRCIALRECDGRRVNVTVIRDPVGKGGQLQLCQQAKGGRMLEFRAEEKARKRTPRRRPSAQQRLEGVE